MNFIHHYKVINKKHSRHPEADRKICLKDAFCLKEGFIFQSLRFWSG